MARVVEVKDLSKHLPEIVFNEKLKNLTAEQIESVALLMEIAYQKGRENSHKQVTYDPTEIKQMVKEIFDNAFNDTRQKFKV